MKDLTNQGGIRREYRLGYQPEYTGYQFRLNAVHWRLAQPLWLVTYNSSLPTKAVNKEQTLPSYVSER